MNMNIMTHSEKEGWWVQKIGPLRLERCREIQKLLKFGSKTPRNSNNINVKDKGKAQETVRKPLRFGLKTPMISTLKMRRRHKTVQKSLKFGYRTPKISEEEVQQKTIQMSSVKNQKFQWDWWWRWRGRAWKKRSKKCMPHDCSHDHWSWFWWTTNVDVHCSAHYNLVS